MAMDKRTFKICEAVHLGLDYLTPMLSNTTQWA